MSEMSFDQGFRVEVVIRAPREAVWRALTEPAEIAHWFGWEYESLPAEIKQIFVDEVTREAPHRIVLAYEQTIELVSDGPDVTIVRITKPGPLQDATWDDVYDEMVRGWHGFFLQLRHYLERHPGESRRTLWLDGTGSPSAILAALDADAPGTVWVESRHQRVTAIDAYGGGLVAVLSAPPLSSAEPGKVQVTLTMHGLSEAQYAEAREQWRARWQSLTSDGTVTP